MCPEQKQIEMALDRLSKQRRRVADLVDTLPKSLAVPNRYAEFEASSIAATASAIEGLKKAVAEMNVVGEQYVAKLVEFLGLRVGNSIRYELPNSGFASVTIEGLLVKACLPRNAASYTSYFCICVAYPKVTIVDLEGTATEYTTKSSLKAAKLTTTTLDDVVTVGGVEMSVMALLVPVRENKRN